MLANYATNIALIDKETNLVTNVIWGMVYQEKEFNTDSQIAVIIDNLAVSIGDNYDGESFYHDGEKVVSVYEALNNIDTLIQETIQEGVNSIDS